MESLLDVGILGHFLVRHCQGGEIWCATEPEEAFQAQQILARLELPPAFSSAIREGAIMLVQFFSPGDKHENSDRSLFRRVDDSVCGGAAKPIQDTTPESAKQAASKKDKKQSAPASAATPDKTAESGKPAEPPKPDANEADRQGRTLRRGGSPARNHASPDHAERQDSQLHGDGRQASHQARRRQDGSRNVFRRLHARRTGSRRSVR